MKKSIAFVVSTAMVFNLSAPVFAESKLFNDAAGVASAAGAVAAIGSPLTAGALVTVPATTTLVTPAVAATTTLVTPAVAATTTLVTPAVEAIPAMAAAASHEAVAGVIYSVGDAYAASATGLAIGDTISVEAIHSALPVLGDSFYEATVVEMGNEAAHFVGTIPGVPGTPAVYATTPGSGAVYATTPGSNAVYQTTPASTVTGPSGRPDQLFGINTATLIQGAAIGLFVNQALIPWITGTHINPAGLDTLTCEGFKPASGKAYRYVNRAKSTVLVNSTAFNNSPQIVCEKSVPVAKAPAAPKSIGLSPNTPERPAPTVKPADEPALAPAPVIKRLPKKG